MNRGDQLVDQAADRMQEFADQAASQGGFKAKLAHELADEAAFLRRLKPSLIRARFKGEAPTGRAPAQGSVAPKPAKPPMPPGEGGPNPWVVLGAAFVAGVVLAKVIDWRGHAHPRD